jgi:alternate signal-mediated exported protein
MNKLTKATIAGAVGVALLLGGAGTLATWNSSATLPGGTIVAGNLKVDATGTVAGVWTSAGKTISLSTYKIVPGDVLTYTKTVNVTATGDNLVATLGLSGGAISASSTASADVQLATELKQSAVITASGTGITQTATQLAADQYTITGATGGTTITVVVTITFPKGTDFSNSDSMTGSVNLAGMAVNLTQN